MANLNKVFLIGRLTQDPELRYTPNGAAVTDLRLAVNRVFSSREGESREETLFIDVTTWNRQAENCCQFLRKGRQVHIEGYLRMDSWDDRTTGEKRSKIKVEAERVQFLDSRRDEGEGEGGGGPAAEDSYGAGAPASRAPRVGKPEPRATASNGPSSRSYGPPGESHQPPARHSAPARPEPDADEPEEDIPF